jgi:hypothetical protein
MGILMQVEFKLYFIFQFTIRLNDYQGLVARTKTKVTNQTDRSKESC